MSFNVELISVACKPCFTFVLSNKRCSIVLLSCEISDMHCVAILRLTDMNCTYKSPY